MTEDFDEGTDLRLAGAKDRKRGWHDITARVAA